MNELKNDAYGSLSQSILVSVQSNSISKASEINGTVEKEFVQNVLAKSMVELVGVEQDTWIDEKKMIAYMFCYLEKEKLLKHYSNRFQEGLTQVQQALDLGLEFKHKGKNTEAIKSFQLAMTGLQDAGNIIAVIRSLNSQFDIDKFYQLQQLVRQQLAEIKLSESINAQEAAGLLVYLLSIQLEQANVVLYPFTFENTTIHSSFSLRFKELLTAAMLQNKHFKPVEASSSGQQNLILRGSVWEEATKLKISCSILAQDENQVLAAAEAFIPIDWLKSNGYEWKPANLEDVLKEMVSMEDLQKSSNDIRVEIFTNKGNYNLLFVENETMDLFVKVNHECYLRIIYSFADGTKTLLLNNHFIDPSLVNRIYRIGESFECAEPFGVERLDVFASTVEFPPLKVNNMNGYQLIDESTEEILKRTRGFKVKQSEILKGESSIVITTMKK
ncbi:MAG: hypothetical protein ACERKD_23740 [Prolixibacteraceae bacterium]